MTSTPFNVGLNEESRVSSRVLRPPGGGHTDIFGGEPEQPRGRRQVPGAAAAACTGFGPEPVKPTNGNAQHQNGQEAAAKTPDEPKAEPDAPRTEPAKVSPRTEAAEPPKAEPPKRVRVPPGGFSSGLWTKGETGQAASAAMDGCGRQSRLLGRLLGRLRGEHHRYSLDKRFSFTSTCISEGCGSTTNEEDSVDVADSPVTPSPQNSQATTTNDAGLDDTQFAANIDLRYGGQYLTPEQLPEFCDQLHHLVEVIRNIQSYAKITGEYPSTLERRLELEACEVAALAAEARNARDAAARAVVQRRAVQAQRIQLTAHLAALRETEVRELESNVRQSDRKLYKSWESLKDSTDPTVFDPLLEEIKHKQTALGCLVRLIEGRKANLSRSAPTSQPLSLPQSHDNDDDSSNTCMSGGRRRHESARRNGCKRRRKDATREPRSVPLSGEPSRHNPQQQGTECTSRFRMDSAGAITLTPFELPSRGSVRDILFFTAN